MQRRSGKVSNVLLIALCVVALLFSFLEGQSVRTRRSRSYDLKLAAAQLAQRALNLLGRERMRLGIPIDSVNDPNGTGLIGLAYSQVTHGRSDISDALTSTNPDFAAVFVDLLNKAGLRKGDTVAISWDGTYPAINIQVLAAVAILGLEPVIVTAQSAASWGANYPGFTWLDQERLLREFGVWSYRSRLATLGGADDAGQGLSPEGRNLLTATGESVGVELFVPESIEQGVERRLRLFSRCRGAIVVGKSAVDFNGIEKNVTSRFYPSRSRRMPDRGLVPLLLDRGTPVIYVSNPSRVALDFRLPIAPVPLPEPGRSRLYAERRYSVPLALILASILGGLLWLVIRYDVERAIFKRQPDTLEEEAV